MTSYRTRRNVLVPTRDGVPLCADNRFPEGDGPFPVLLEANPVRRDLLAEVALHCRAGVPSRPGRRVCRGDTGHPRPVASQGEFTPFSAEAADRPLASDQPGRRASPGSGLSGALIQKRYQHAADGIPCPAAHRARRRAPAALRAVRCSHRPDGRMAGPELLRPTLPRSLRT